ncbi:phosphotransferase enzyme family protein [Acetobacter fallax]|uniref:Phosphotransferase n=1 Tax=Acetobacter fallax TaxID=1737473 RepID=A0ABX0KEX8_9PROT|nr:phosphotransferase [Acetobacter fallax]NHO33678.1 phosphotransferase [Acetobacter fallax]NHO36499.1 phosphotransferase [Acetobacter fallax]
MSNTHYAHGLGNELKLPDWPGIRMPELQRVLAQFPTAGVPQHILWHSPRPFSAAAEVRTTRGILFVKRHHQSVRSISDLAEEHKFIDHLRKKHLPVADILKTQDGETSVADDIWTYEVHQAGRGLDLYRDSPSWTAFRCPAHAFAAGTMLANLHKAAADFHAPPRHTRLLVANYRIFGTATPLDTLAAELQGRPALARFLTGRPWKADIRERLIDPFHPKAFALLRNEPSLRTHGDWHASNLLWSSPGEASTVTTILDFGLSDQTFALFDLATAIERNLISWLDAERGTPPVCNLEQLDALLHGYSSVTPLSNEALNKVSALLPLVHADFALSEIEYFAGILSNETDALIAYDLYLLGHADWFRQEGGKKLLSHLNELARQTA